jgi:pimeloyl-ACP methyl ester carboxylesterase
MPAVQRRDFKVKTQDDMNIAVREVRMPGAAGNAKAPMILLHGTRVPGISEYDLPVPNGSFAEELAEAGHVTYIVDARGFGKSDRWPEMDQPRQMTKPLARAMEITRDVDAAVRDLRKATGHDQVGLFGWGVGGTICMMYAAQWPEFIKHLILYNSPYGGVPDHPRFNFLEFEDPARPGHFNRERFGNYNFNKIEMLVDMWDKYIPIDDKDSWRDPAMVKAFEKELIDGDPSTMQRDPPSYRSPNGMLEDSFFMGKGHKLVHAGQVYARTMIIRPDLDFLCRPGDVHALKTDLVNAEEVRIYEPENTTHYLIVDRPERGRAEAIAEILDFLK